MFGRNDRQKLLGQVPLFAACSDKELERLARLAEVVDFPAGQTLMSEGDMGHEFFVIIDGEVGVVIGGDTVAKLGPGQYVGETALLDPGPRTATVTALQPVRLRALAREPFLAAITGNQLSTDALRRLIAARAPREAGVADGVLEPSA